MISSLPSFLRRAALTAALVTPIASANAQAVWFVNAAAAAGGTGTSWNTAFQDLQAAFTAAQATDQIWVAAGTYRPSVQTIPGDPRSATFLLPHDIAIYGGFRGVETTLAERQGWFAQTILSGDIGAPSLLTDNCYHVVTMRGTTQFVDTVLDGFTIRDGYGHGGAVPSRGAGITVSIGDGTQSPTLRAASLIVRDNYADQGAGIAVTNLGVVRIRRSTIAGNQATGSGGGAYVLTGWLLSAGNRWQGNVADQRGGGVFTTSTAPGMVRFVNDVFAMNQAPEGGGLYVAGSQFVNGTASVSNCTFGRNLATDGVSIYANTNATQPAALTVTNSILWHEPAGGPATLVGGGSTVSVTWSCVLGGFPGAGNIAVDPQFVDSANGNLHLVASSPCHDAGDSGVLAADFGDVDADGNFNEPLPLDHDLRRRLTDNPNVANTGLGTPPVDMGAYEF